MKRFTPSLMYIAAIALFLATGLFANPARAQTCMPKDAGGTGSAMVTVGYLDDKATVITWFCPMGEGQSVIVLDEWKSPVKKLSGPNLATELKRLQVLEGYSGKITPELKRKAKDQLIKYEHGSVGPVNKPKDRRA